MAITGPKDLTANVRSVHDDFLDKLRAQHQKKKAKIDKLLSLVKLRKSIEGLLDRHIQKTAKAALKAHLTQLEKGEVLEPFLSIEIDIDRIAEVAWGESPDGLKKEYSAKDLGWSMAILLENAGYFVQEDGKIAIDIPLTDEAAASMLDEDGDDIVDDVDTNSDDIDDEQELQIPEGDEEEDEEEDSGESNE